MSAATISATSGREPELLGQTVVVIGGSAGIGLETARRARAEGARLILTGRNPERLQIAARDLEALSTTAFDANDPAALENFFGKLPAAIDHVMVTAGQPTGLSIRSSGVWPRSTVKHWPRPKPRSIGSGRRQLPNFSRATTCSFHYSPCRVRGHDERKFVI